MIRLVFASVLLTACGDDSGGGEVDGPGGDPADAAPQIDSPPPTPDGPGTIPGLDQVCNCSTACTNSLDCYVEEPGLPHFLDCASDAGVSESGVCRPRVASCETNAMDCPFPSKCLVFSDGSTTFGVCAPAETEGETCGEDVGRCADGLICVKHLMSDTYSCREFCTAQADCESPEVCRPIGMGRMACIPD